VCRVRQRQNVGNYFLVHRHHFPHAVVTLERCETLDDNTRRPISVTLASTACDRDPALLPGTELSFAGDVACLSAGLLGWKTKTIDHQTAIFRQVNKEKVGRAS
jgi:hypothetical protein